MNPATVSLLALLSAVGLATGAAAIAATSANPTLCAYGEMSRTIEVVYSDPGQPVPCEVIYDKSGEGSMEILWRADVEAGYCEVKAAELIEKLKGFGWRCGDKPEDG